MTDPTPSPLLNDPKRDATATLRGYSYQILRTIDAWLDLPTGEILVIEGAEDLDHLSKDGALVEQVKDTAGSGRVTLRSEGALAAIANLFEHQTRNPGVPLRFRYLTTSTVGSEKGDPLALGGPALDVWEDIRRRPRSKAVRANAEAIRTFLSGNGALPEKVRNWIASASTTSFIARIVEPFEWLSGQGDVHALSARIEARLIELCETRNLSAQDAVKALDALHRHAWTVATNNKREPLRRGDLLRIVDEAGRTSLPTAQLLELLSALTSSAGGSTNITSLNMMEAPPRRPARHLERPNVQSAIAHQLAAGIVVIHGGTGMGKTDLAADVARGASDIGWINLRDADLAAMKSGLRAAAQATAGRGGLTLVLDDLEPGDDPRSLEAPLADLRAALQKTSGALIVTSSQPLPPRLIAALSLDANQQMQAPALEQQDIERYLIEQGSPKKLADPWSKIIWATTGGHPQLVNARVVALESDGFPNPSYDDLTRQSADAVNVRTEARRLVSALPAGQREMLCRASLMSGRQPRSRLLRVAEIEPSITGAGDVLDRLAGPWLELTASSDLRASPLLRDLGTESMGARWATQMHAKIAAAYVADRNLDAGDVSSILLHCMLGETARPLIPLIPSLMQAPAEIWQQIGETAGIYAHVGVEADLKAPFRDELDLAIFRLIQFRIAAQRGDGNAPEVLERALREGETGRGDNDVFLLLLLWQAIQNEELALDPVTRVRHALRFARIAERVGAALPDRMAAAGLDPEDGDWPATDTLAAFGTLAAIRDADDVVKILDELEALDTADAKLLLSGLGSVSGFGSLALTRLWLAETQRPAPRWPYFVTTLERLAAAAIGHGVLTLAAPVAALLVRVTDEDLSDPAAAEKTADRFLADVGDDPSILAAKAKILWRAGRESEGLTIYDEALSRFDPADSNLVDALRDAGVAAARIFQWDRSAAFFRRALSADTSADVPARMMGLGGDLALSLQLAGRSSDAADALNRAAKPMFDAEFEPVEPMLSTWQRINEAAKMILADVSGEAPFDPAVMARAVGMCSSLDPFDWAKAVPAPLDIVLHSIASLDAQVNVVPATAFKLQERIRRSPNLLLKCVSGNLLFDLDMRRADLSHIVADALAQLGAISIAGEDAADNAKRSFDPLTVPIVSEDRLEFVRVRIIAALFALASRGEIDRSPYQAWRDTLPEDVPFQSTRELIDWCERMFTNEHAPWVHLFPTPPTWEQHVVAALAAVMRQRLSPDHLLICHALWANYLRQPLIREMTAPMAAALMTEQWLDRCDSPAQLIAPRLTVPAIRAAATGGTTGWGRIRAMMSAASEAVGADSRNFAAAVIDGLDHE